MKFLTKSVIFIMLTSLYANSLAQQQQQSIIRELEVGALFTSGNTDEQALNFAGEYTILDDRWEYGYTLDALYAASDDETTGQRLYGVAGQVTNSQRIVSSWQERLMKTTGLTGLTVNLTPHCRMDGDFSKVALTLAFESILVLVFGGRGSIILILMSQFFVLRGSMSGS